jgi:hypothetical protein
MIALLTAVPAVLRQWRVMAIAAALLMAGHSHLARLKAERGLERCRAQAATERRRLEQAEAAAKALAADGRRRMEAQARMLAEAKRANAGESERIEALRRSAGARRGGETCALSETLRQAQGAL